MEEKSVEKSSIAAIFYLHVIKFTFENCLFVSCFYVKKFGHNTGYNCNLNQYVLNETRFVAYFQRCLSANCDN